MSRIVVASLLTAVLATGCGDEKRPASEPVPQAKDHFDKTNDLNPKSKKSGPKFD